MGFYDRIVFKEVEINGQKLGSDTEEETEQNPTGGDNNDGLNRETDTDGEGVLPDTTGDIRPGQQIPGGGDGGDGRETGESDGDENAPDADTETPPTEGEETLPGPTQDIEDPQTADNDVTGDEYSLPDETGDDTAGELGDDPTPPDTEGEIDTQADTGREGEIGDDTEADTTGELTDDNGEGGTGEEGEDSGTIDDDSGDDSGGGDGSIDDGAGGDTDQGDGTIDDTGDGGAGGDGGDDPDGGDASGNINDDIKNIEANILADLSDEQKKIQSDELRQNFINMYNSVVDIIDKVNNIQKDEESLSVFEFISTQLLILKDTVNMTITKTFDTKSYYENMNTYQHCLAILVTVDKLIKETEKNQKKSEVE